MAGYTILQRQQLSPRTPAAILIGASVLELMYWLPLDGSEWSCDIETKGTDASDPACYIVGIGFANDEHCLYVDLASLSRGAVAYLKRFLRQARLIAFNAFFDGTFLQVWCGQWLNWTEDTYALFKTLSGEGWAGQKWKLETAITDVLGWIESSKAAFDALLKAHGLTKATMYQLGPEQIGSYCCGDADATWQLRRVLHEHCKGLP